MRYFSPRRETEYCLFTVGRGRGNEYIFLKTGPKVVGSQCGADREMDIAVMMPVTAWPRAARLQRTGKGK